MGRSKAAKQQKQQKTTSTRKVAATTAAAAIVLKSPRRKAAPVSRRPAAATAAAVPSSMAPILATYAIMAHALEMPDQVRRFEFRVLFESDDAHQHANRNKDDAFLEPLAAAIDATFPDTYDVQEDSIIQVSYSEMDVESDTADARIHLMFTKKHEPTDALSIADGVRIKTIKWTRKDATSAFADDETLEADRVPNARAAEPTLEDRDQVEEEENIDPEEEDDDEEEEEDDDDEEEEHVSSDEEAEEEE